MENTTVEIKTCKTEKKTSIFIVNKRLKEDKVKFLIGHDKNKYSVLLHCTLKKLSMQTILIHPIN